MNASPSQPSPEQYETAKGCLTLTILSVVTLGAVIAFIMMFGNMGA